MPWRPGGEAVVLGLAAKFGGTGVVQGEMDLGMHRAFAFHSRSLGKRCVWMRTDWAPGVPSGSGR